jgi:hypothetical protein
VLILGIFPVNVDSIEPTLFEQMYRRLGKLSSTSGRVAGPKIGRVCPSSNGEEDFNVAMFFLEEEELLLPSTLFQLSLVHEYVHDRHTFVIP